MFGFILCGLLSFCCWILLFVLLPFVVLRIPGVCGWFSLTPTALTLRGANGPRCDVKSRCHTDVEGWLQPPLCIFKYPCVHQLCAASDIRKRCTNAEGFLKVSHWVDALCNVYVSMHKHFSAHTCWIKECILEDTQKETHEMHFVFVWKRAKKIVSGTILIKSIGFWGFALCNKNKNKLLFFLHVKVQKCTSFVLFAKGHGGLWLKRSYFCF